MAVVESEVAKAKHRAARGAMDEMIRFLGGLRGDWYTDEQDVWHLRFSIDGIAMELTSRS